jgi:hypothetical protein
MANSEDEASESDYSLLPIRYSRLPIRSAL